jgi:hypothetical protein
MIVELSPAFAAAPWVPRLRMTKGKASKMSMNDVVPSGTAVTTIEIGANSWLKC